MPEFRAGKPTCHLGLVAPRTQPAGFQVITWDTVRQDPAGQATGAPISSITVERDGVYLVTFGVSREAVAVSSAVEGHVQVDAVDVVDVFSPAGAPARSCSGARTMFLSEGQVVRLVALLHTTAVAAFAETATFLTLDRVGPVKHT